MPENNGKKRECYTQFDIVRKKIPGEGNNNSKRRSSVNKFSTTIFPDATENENVIEKMSRENVLDVTCKYFLRRYIKGDKYKSIQTDYIVAKRFFKKNGIDSFDISDYDMEKIYNSLLKIVHELGEQENIKENENEIIKPLLEGKYDILKNNLSLSKVYKNGYKQNIITGFLKSIGISKENNEQEIIDKLKNMDDYKVVCDYIVPRSGFKKVDSMIQIITDYFDGLIEKHNPEGLTNPFKKYRTKEILKKVLELTNEGRDGTGKVLDDKGLRKELEDNRQNFTYQIGVPSSTTMDNKDSEAAISSGSDTVGTKRNLDGDNSERDSKKTKMDNSRTNPSEQYFVEALLELRYSRIDSKDGEQNTLVRREKQKNPEEQQPDNSQYQAGHSSSFSPNRS